MEITNGYSAICPDCNIRHGLKKSGPRELDIKPCKDCLQAKAETERVRYENSRKQEPPPEVRNEFVKKMKQARAERKLMRL